MDVPIKDRTDLRELFRSGGMPCRQCHLSCSDCCYKGPDMWPCGDMTLERVNALVAADVLERGWVNV